MTEPLLTSLQSWLSRPVVLAAWGVLAGLSLLALARDLRRHNPQIQGLMRWVWVLTVAYSGPLGLAIYHYSGRRQIATDSMLRRGFRSTAHCYSGCGAGEVVGLLLAVGALGLRGWWVVGITFVLAYAFGFGLTFGPLVQEGVGVGRAATDAFWSESASIVVMEATAIGVDQVLGGKVGIDHPLFWSSMVVSLSLGLLAAFPVNLALIAGGVKAGMHDPRESH